MDRRERVAVAARPVARPDGTGADTGRTIAELRRQLRERTRELEEAREFQAATSDVLKAISRSTFDLQPLLETLVATAARLCSAGMGLLSVREAGGYRVVATFATSPEYEAFIRGRVLPMNRGSVAGRTAVTGQVVHLEDLEADPEFTLNESIALERVRTAIGVPLLRDGVVVGVFSLGRHRVEPFTDQHIELVRTFADQAVIAIESTRLLAEVRESYEHQRAVADLVQLINDSPGNVQPVFDAMVYQAMRLCEAFAGNLWLYENGRFAPVAVSRHSRLADWMRQHGSTRAAPETPGGRLLAGEPVVHIRDCMQDPAYFLYRRYREMVDIEDCRTLVAVALRQEDTLVGMFTIYRQEVRLFSEREIALLQSFAGQAVVAMGNARLLTELRESLEQQQAIAELLQVINSSPGDLIPVFDVLLEKALSLCEAASGSIHAWEGEGFRRIASRGLPAQYLAAVPSVTGPVLPGSLAARVVAGENVIAIPDLAAAEVAGLGPRFGPFVRLAGARSYVAITLRKDETLLGYITVYRREPRPFSENEIALLRSFAAQAVIAMENARLLDEIRQRQAELRVTFDNMGDGVAMFDADMRLAAWNRNFQQIIDLPDEFLAAARSFEDYIRFLAGRGEFGPIDIEAEIHGYLERGRQAGSLERERPDGRIIEVRHNPVPGGGFVLIYGDVTERKRAEEEIRAARDAAETALDELKATQQQLIMQQKMAALGQLTAGIAHEIKNPLNFVNNFAGLSVELLDELKEATAPAVAALDDEKRAEIDETIAMLTGNLDKITEHGQRADNIVKSMLEHSRGVSGERREVNLNNLIDEALNLAYHGARAQDREFNIGLERDYAPLLKPIELVPQEITRVFLNLFSNGFYAASKRARGIGNGSFQPLLRVSTQELGDAVEVRIRDNGIGIPAEIKDRLFQPFFTTKPAGEGTGLGLSISYDIVAQQHRGTIKVDSEEGAYTEFTIRLPRY